LGGADPPFKRGTRGGGGGAGADVLYRTGVAPRDDFRLVRQLARSLASSGGSNPPLRDEASSIAVGRQGLALHHRGGDGRNDDASSPSSVLVRTLDCHVRGLLRKHAGHDGYRLCPDVPAELRVYQRRGTSMAWHQDDVLYDPPQLEVVYTVENTSDCATRWRDRDGRERAVETDPNSVLALAAGGAYHCVTGLRFGRRVIVKMAYILPGARRVVDPPAEKQKRTQSKRRSAALNKRF
jgi:hypothetical protein